MTVDNIYCTKLTTLLGWMGWLFTPQFIN